ncbi:MAG: energy transducer TonB, partial [Bradyrhizobium sp.]|uniref:energy transducer TonB n=1 Tax=Bradyrhizobium sp. TaxID=376 RepID=UPI003918C4A8
MLRNNLRGLGFRRRDLRLLLRRRGDLGLLLQRRRRELLVHGLRGVVRLVFTLGRGGQVLSSHLGGSSGNPTFDARALAMVRQA